MMKRFMPDLPLSQPAVTALRESIDKLSKNDFTKDE
jgi:hypothetical protein